MAIMHCDLSSSSGSVPIITRPFLVWRSLCAQAARYMLPFAAPLLSRLRCFAAPSITINLTRPICCSSLKRNFLSHNHKAKAMMPATPANTAPLLTIFVTAPPFDGADAEAAEPDAVDDDPVAELAAVAAEVELAEPPETGVGVGLPSVSLKFTRARWVRSCAWMTTLRLPRKEFRPGSMET
jgi:hypothetical protein